jgi:two-component system, response regulator, stage 0 sporulation protein F
MKLVIYLADPASASIPQIVLDTLQQRDRLIDEPLSWADTLRRLEDGTLNPDPVSVLTNVDMTGVDWPGPGGAMPGLADRYVVLLLARGARETGGEATEMPVPPDGARYTLLVVDDEPDIEELFKQRFRSEVATGECRLHFAHSGNEALRKLKRGLITPEPVVILTDINMPGMDGFKLLEEAKSFRPELHVVMVTAYGDADRKDRARAGGATGYFEKPIDFKKLKASIREIFSKDTPPAPKPVG